MKNTQIKIGVVVTNNEKILLIKERVKPTKGYLWNIIKGTYGEVLNETIFEAAIRECQEEAGIKVKLCGIINSTILNSKEKLKAQYNFSAQVISGKPKIANEIEQKQRHEDISEVRWFTREEVKAKNQKEFISKQAFDVIQDFLKGKNFSLEILQQIK